MIARHRINDCLDTTLRSLCEPAWYRLICWWILRLDRCRFKEIRKQI